MINIVGYDSDVDSVKRLIKYLNIHVHCPAKGDYKITFFRFENGKLTVVDKDKDPEYISNFKKHCEVQINAAIQVLGYATINQQHLYKTSYLDSLKNKCYKYLEVMLNLNRGVISKGD